MTVQYMYQPIGQRSVTQNVIRFEETLKVRRVRQQAGNGPSRRHI